MYFKYGLEDKPSGGKILIFGLQWLAVTIPLIIIVGNILGVLSGGEINISYLQDLLLMVGLVMLVQLLYGHKLPLVVGPATVLLIAVLASQGQASGAINTSIIVGGVVLALVAGSGLLKYLKRLFTPRVIMVILLLIAFTLSPTILNLITIDNGVSPGINLIFAMFLTLLVFTAHRVLHGLWKSTLPLWIMILGSLSYYILFGVFTPLSSNLAALSLPGSFTISLAVPELTMLVSFLICFLALAINDLGSIQAVGSLLKAGEMETRVKRGITITGVGNILSGLIGVIGPVNYSMSPGVIAATGNASRYTLIPAAVGLLLLACSPLSVGFISSIPSPVVGTILIYVMTAQMAAAFLLALENQAFQTLDHGLVVGLPIIIGTVVAFLPTGVTGQLPLVIRPLLGNGFVMGVLAVLFLEHVVFLARDG
ncbi:MAG: solute carrier family 23 protein [Euryarchaeota archaeon]|jgi:uracil permease|nr:solute carrier family 23 protein [Euryarchaeota archaeon]